MSKVKFFNYNLVTQSQTDITASSEDPFFPASNIKSQFSTKVFRTPAGTLNANIVFDFKTVEPVDSILIKGHLIDNFGFTSCTVEANPSNLWTSPAFTTTIAPNTEFNIAHKTITEQNYRFWRVTIENLTDYAELSNIFIGKAISLENNNIDFGWSYKQIENNKKSYNRYRQLYSDKIGTEKMVGANFNLLNKDEVEIILDMFNENRETTPLYFLVDENELIIENKERFLFYGYFESMPTYTNSAFGLYDMSFSIRGES